MTKTISKNGLAIIKKWEGLRTTSYLCPAGIPTVGYGSTGTHVKLGMTITEKQAEELLLKDVKRFENCVNECVKHPINQNQFDALVSWAFNVGCGNVRSSSLVKLLNQGKVSEASEELLLWCKATVKGEKVVLKGLLNRRKEEKALFEKPIPKPIVKPKPIAKKIYHVVKSGDTVSELAKTYKSSLSNIKTWNRLDSHYTIHIGRKIRVK